VKTKQDFKRQYLQIYIILIILTINIEMLTRYIIIINIEISSQIYLKKRTHAYSRTRMNADMRAA